MRMDDGIAIYIVLFSDYIFLERKKWIMSECNAIQNSDWVRLNVGGKVFQTTKGTLSRHSESFLARLVTGDLPSEKDESGAYLLDSDPEYFRIVLNYFRRGVLNLDDKKLTLKGLLSEADFFNIQPLVDDIHMAMKNPDSRMEIVLLPRYDTGGIPNNTSCSIIMSETYSNYEILIALRQKIHLSYFDDGRYYFLRTKANCETFVQLELILHNHGFKKEKDEVNCLKYVRFVDK
ncbi:BTB/POZ domain-containing protein [Ditylenchus destructor]|uniref:BTB/POZ domain-containing protein n=1 Tax=Ditylenchus destructor TaxID=166010 RepID=A0AAD4MP19_9BILA|nr:BTB/POZ domain-containing protein [Ditylenchus destructor]